MAVLLARQLLLRATIDDLLLVQGARDSEADARTVLRKYVGQVRVDRHGKSHAQVDIWELVAGVGFEPTTFGL